MVSFRFQTWSKNIVFLYIINFSYKLECAFLWVENMICRKEYVNGANTSFIKCLKYTLFVVLLSLALSMITIDSGFYDCMSRRR